jgi:hypothetical protein
MNHYGISRLPAPTIPVAEHDGLIKNEHLSGTIEIIVPVWEGARPGDDCSVQINDRHVLSSPPLPDPLTEDDLKFHVPAFLFEDEGVYRLTYAARNQANGVVEFSKNAVIRVDRTPPGAVLLAPVIFSQINLGDVLKGLICGYAGMDAGDVVQTFCNGVSGLAYQVVHANLIERPIQITFDRPFLDSLDSTLIRVSYHVTDRAGNQSIESQPVELTYNRLAANT